MSAQSADCELYRKRSVAKPRFCNNSIWHVSVVFSMINWSKDVKTAALVHYSKCCDSLFKSIKKSATVIPQQQALTSMLSLPVSHHATCSLYAV